VGQVKAIQDSRVDHWQVSEKQHEAQELNGAADDFEERTEGAIEWLCRSAGPRAVAQQQVTAALMAPDLVVEQPGSSGRHRHQWAWATFDGTLAHEGGQQVAYPITITMYDAACKLDPLQHT
jgi:hypothetical protein